MDSRAFRSRQGLHGHLNLRFSVDNPFQDDFTGIGFSRASPLSEEEREKLAHSKAVRMLKLPEVGESNDYRGNPGFVSFPGLNCTQPKIRRSAIKM